jgi:hypothetical protein
VSFSSSMAGYVSQKQTGILRWAPLGECLGVTFTYTDGIIPLLHLHLDRLSRTRNRATISARLSHSDCEFVTNNQANRLEIGH